MTYNAFGNRLNVDDYNIIKSEVNNELIYINSMINKLNAYYPKEIIYNLHNLNILQLEQLKYTYNFDYTVHKDGSITFTYKKITY